MYVCILHINRYIKQCECATYAKSIFKITICHTTLEIEETLEMTRSSLSISSVYFILHNLMIKHFSPYKASSISWFQARGPPITILVLNENIHRYVPKVQCHAKAKCHALENRNPCLSLWQRCEDTELCAHTSVKLKKRPMPPTNLKTSPAYFPIIGAQGEHGWLLFTQLCIN